MAGVLDEDLGGALGAVGQDRLDAAGAADHMAVRDHVAALIDHDGGTDDFTGAVGGGALHLERDDGRLGLADGFDDGRFAEVLTLRVGLVGP